MILHVYISLPEYVSRYGGSIDDFLGRGQHDGVFHERGEEGVEELLGRVLRRFVLDRRVERDTLVHSHTHIQRHYDRTCTACF